MTKAVRNLDVVFDFFETESLLNEFDNKIKNLAIKHFVDKEGMSQEEANRRVNPKTILYEKTLDIKNQIDLIHGILVECEISE